MFETARRAILTLARLRRGGQQAVTVNTLRLERGRPWWQGL